MRHTSALSDLQAGWQTKDALDQETKSNHTVTATDPDGAADTIGVPVAVTNVDEKGMVTLLEMHPSFRAAATSIPADPDSGVTGTTRQGAGSGAPDGAGTDINGATSASCTSVETDGAVPPGHRDAHRRRGLQQDGRRAGGQRGNRHVGGYVHGIFGGRPDGCPVTWVGSWASDCASDAKSGSYAQYYTFKLDRRKQVEINLTSAADLYLVRRQGKRRAEGT